MNPLEKKGCGCPCHKAPGILVILFGLSFLLRNLGVIDDQIHGIAWPVIVMIGGLTKVCSGFCKCCSKTTPV
jgi:hypothetical protein